MQEEIGVKDMLCLCGLVLVTDKRDFDPQVHKAHGPSTPWTKEMELMENKPRDRRNAILIVYHIYVCTSWLETFQHDLGGKIQTYWFCSSLNFMSDIYLRFDFGKLQTYSLIVLLKFHYRLHLNIFIVVDAQQLSPLCFIKNSSQFFKSRDHIKKLFL